MGFVVVVVGDRGRDEHQQLLEDLKRSGVDVMLQPPIKVEASAMRQPEVVNVARFEALYGRAPLRGEVGCAIAHREAYHLFLGTEAPWALILEDDAGVLHAESLLLRCQQLAESLDSERCTVVQFYRGFVPEKCMRAVHGLDHIRRSLIPPPGAVGYFINRSAALSFALAQDPVSFVADWPVSDAQTLFLADTQDLVGHPDAAASLVDSLSRRHKPSRRFVLSIFTGIRYLRYRSEFHGPLDYLRAVLWPQLLWRVCSAYERVQLQVRPDTNGGLRE